MSLAEQVQSGERPEGETPLLDKPLLSLWAWDREKVAFAALMLIAVLLRFWDLGSRALHHDESLHALYSWYLTVGRGYVHDPLMHGPFQFHGVALVYFLFGTSDYAARILPALFGTAVVVLPYFLREHLGRLGALFTAALLAFSPSMLYYSRFLRNDILIVVWDLLLVIGMWRFMRHGRRVDLLLAVAALSLSFATKEVAYITVVIFGSYLLLTSVRELVPRAFRRFNFQEVSSRTGLLITMGTLTMPLGAAGVVILWNIMGFSPDNSSKLVAGGLVVAILTGVSTLIGWRWNWRLWLTSAALFYGIFLVLHTTFFTNLAGFGSGIWGSLEYWLAQQGVERGNQPGFYYLLLLPIYEFLPIAIALIGAVYFGLIQRFRDEFSLFLVWWVLGSFLLYGYAGEKMPWLSLHIALPLILLGGKTLGAIIERVPWRELQEKGALYLAFLVPLIPLALGALVSAGDPFDGLPEQPLHLLQSLAALAALAFLVGSSWQLAKRLRVQLMGQTLFLVAAVLLSGLTLRAAWQASYFHGDIPVEILVYTQTSPEVPRIRDTIERISAETGQGNNLPITVDAGEGFTWPWAWYLRDYKNVDYPSLGADPTEPRGTVLLLNANSQQAMGPYLDKYEPGQIFPHRWWFPEDYRTLNLGGVLRSIINPTEWSRWWSYLYNRELAKPLGSSDALVYYPKGFASDLNLLGQRPALVSAPPQPRQGLPQPTLVHSDLILDHASSGLERPKGLAVDASGNLYVVDSRAAKVIKFDPNGQVVVRVGHPGAEEGEFLEPWGIAVDANGKVYVADTWNHRVQKFDANLNFLSEWGTFASVPSGGKGKPGQFWGPRDIVIDAAGNLYVTDTGNKRIQKFSPDGQLIGMFGEIGSGKGQFQEPVGIAISPSGEIFVADTWNLRVQRFTEAFGYVGEFPVSGWLGQGIDNKPYLVMDKNGDVLITDPESHRLLKYTSAGELINVFGRYGSDGASFNLPAAIAIGPRGEVYVSDSGNSRVLRFPPID